MAQDRETESWRDAGTHVHTLWSFCPSSRDAQRGRSFCQQKSHFQTWALALDQTLSPKEPLLLITYPALAVLVQSPKGARTAGHTAGLDLSQSDLAALSVGALVLCPLVPRDLERRAALSTTTLLLLITHSGRPQPELRPPGPAPPPQPRQEGCLAQEPGGEKPLRPDQLSESPGLEKGALQPQRSFPEAELDRAGPAQLQDAGAGRRTEQPLPRHVGTRCRLGPGAWTEAGFSAKRPCLA